MVRWSMLKSVMGMNIQVVSVSWSNFNHRSSNLSWEPSLIQIQVMMCSPKVTLMIVEKTNAKILRTRNYLNPYFVIPLYANLMYPQCKTLIIFSRKCQSIACSEGAWKSPLLTIVAIKSIIKNPLRYAVAVYLKVGLFIVSGTITKLTTKSIAKSTSTIYMNTSVTKPNLTSIHSSSATLSEINMNWMYRRTPKIDLAVSIPFELDLSKYFGIVSLWILSLLYDFLPLNTTSCAN